MTLKKDPGFQGTKPIEGSNLLQRPLPVAVPSHSFTGKVQGCKGQRFAPQRTALSLAEGGWGRVGAVGTAVAVLLFERSFEIFLCLEQTIDQVVSALQMSKFQLIYVTCIIRCRCKKMFC